MTRAILQVLWGPLGGHRVVLAPGDVVRVGRSEDADLVLAHDRELARVHFEIDWDGTTCEVRHRQGEATLLGGRPIEQADVPHGGWIQAGETSFTVHLENHTPPASPRRATADDTSRRKDVIASLRRESSLWAVLDAARDPRILQVLKEAVDPARSLYEGPKGDALASVAPWLVHLQRDSHLLELLVHEGWGEAWGIYLAWDASERDVRRHLRRFLMVEDDDTRERMVFRFYDPRVLPVFLPTCTALQRDALFGDVEAFLLEGDAGELLRLDRPARPDLDALAAGETP